MRSRGWAAPSWRLLLLALLAMPAVVCADDKPEVTVTTIDNPPFNLAYFEDSDVVMFRDKVEKAVYRSEDAGKSWGKVKDIPDGSVEYFIPHPHDFNTAFALSMGLKHYKTTDRGKSWHEFESGTRPSKFQGDKILSFHAGDPDRIIFNGMDCEILCDEESTYTTDGFKTVKMLRAFTAGCYWAKAAPEFTTGDSEKDKSRTLCMVTDPFSFFLTDQTLHISDSFFAVKNDKIDEFQPNMDGNKDVAGVVNMATVKKYLVVATTTYNSDEMALFVTDDTVKWHRAIFPSDDSHDHSHRVAQNGYTVLESTNYSIQIDVMTSEPSKPVGVLFTSNSNGTYFTENVPYTNRAPNGMVDFEKISGIQGIFMVNIVENGAEIEKSGGEKVVVSRITFDDGRSFEPIKSGDDNIHLHSFTEIDNVGRVFSSPAPGLVMGNGNTGKSLGLFTEANLYVSDDAGVSWKQALEGPQKYEFGDSGSILVAVKDSAKEDVKEISYSLNHGEKWESVPLPKDLEIQPIWLTTTQDSTSLKFLILGRGGGTFHMVSVDFEAMKKDTCSDKDMEDWHARVNDKGESTCLMGHKQTFRRRKKDANCFINNKKFEEPLPQTEDCECTDADFECDYNFQRDPEDSSVCKNVGPIAVPDGECKNGAKIFMGSSGWRLIPGNTCKRTKGEQKDKEVERKCGEGESAPSQPPANGDISSKKVDFDAKLQDFQKIYVEQGKNGKGGEEVVIVRPAENVGGGMLSVENKIWRSTDHGKTFERILEGEDVKGIFNHKHYNNIVFFTTTDEKVIYSMDQARTFHSFKAPTKPLDGVPLSFHPDNADWLIWVGQQCDKIGKTETCFLEASVSIDRGDNWRTMHRYVHKCEFTGSKAYKTEERELKQVVCLVREEEKNDAPLTIVSSNDFFDLDKTNFEGTVQEFATMSEFIVVAGEDAEKGLHALASLDGKHFEQAHFPLDFNKDHENVYTLLDSSTHAVNLFVREQGVKDREYGSIIKSNSNGTSYVLSAAHVNCNHENYVDFEKVAGLEGVVLINVVSNLGKKEKTKKLQTKISHNDGSEWGFLAPPSKDVDGKSYKCSSSKGDELCALHLHHYTERDDKRNTFAASTAVGLIFGIGNVGSSLGDIENADTFMSSDGGVTWNNVKKGHWTWQYGDQGSIIVLVNRATTKNSAKTNVVSYSLDEGKTWKDYKFSEEEVTVLDITTLRSGMSRNFLLWCRKDKKIFSINLDFTGLTDAECMMIDDNDKASDYYRWSPTHPLQDDDCMFGHVAQYLRKKTDHKCFNSRNLKRLYGYSDCACSRRDFEW